MNTRICADLHITKVPDQRKINLVLFIISYMMRPKITEENFQEFFWDYITQNYGHLISDYRNECPYNLDLDNAEMEWKQILTWFSYDRKDHNGITLLDKFVDQYIDDKRLATKILQMTSLFFDTFLITRSADANNIMMLRSITNRKKYAVETVGLNNDIYQKDRYFMGRIHPWHEDGTHKIIGIASVSQGNDDELARKGFITPRLAEQIFKNLEGDSQKRAESIPISSHLKSATLLKNFPAEWINVICISLKINSKLRKREKIKKIAKVLTTPSSLKFLVDGLSEEQKTALKLTLEKGGAIKHSILCKRVGPDDTSLNWEEESDSVVGSLRRLGLLMVGKKIIKNRNYKVAVIPSDVAAQLTRYL